MNVFLTYMSDNSALIRQLANRCRVFHSDTGITQTQMAKAVGMTDRNYSTFLSGNKGIGSDTTCLSLKYTAMSPRQAIAVFSKPVFSASILNLQEKDRRLKFTNPGRVATEGATDDPDGSITGASDAQR
jgi:hypothetical protein